MKVRKEHLKLYMLGAAAAIGLAIVLQNQLGNRVQLSLGTAKKDPPKGLDRVKVQIKEVKNKLKGKEKKLKEGHTIFLKDIIGDIAMARSPKKDVAEEAEGSCSGLYSRGDGGEAGRHRDEEEGPDEDSGLCL